MQGAVNGTRTSPAAAAAGVEAGARPGDFWIPQRGLFAVGRAHFEAFDPTRHAPAVPASAAVMAGGQA